jgi:hypothetical protein
MKIALIGATGVIGRRIAQEALSRGHAVTAVVRDPGKLEIKDAKLSSVKADALDAGSLAAAAAGHDAVVSSYGPGQAPPSVYIEATKSIIEGVRRAGVKRLITVGGAGSLEVKPGLQLVDSPEFPAAWKGVALAHRDALGVLKKADLDWTCISPAAMIAPGERTGKYRTGIDQLLTNAKGESRISAEDYAVALLDELEMPHNVRRRMTVAY